MSEQRTFVLVDGENIDATIGNSLLNRRPTPEERPRWERVTALLEIEGDVMLCSHDGDFAPQARALLGSGRRVGLLGLREYMSTELTKLGLEVYDLEDHVEAFLSPLPRVRIIPLEEFDPMRFLR